MNPDTPQRPPVTVSDIRDLAAPPSARVEVTLDQIINGGFALPANTPGETPVVVKPLNLRGYTMLIKKFGSLAAMPDVSVDPVALIDVVAILVNQDRPLDRQQSADEIAARIAVDKLSTLDKIVGEQIAPFLSRLASEINRIRETAKVEPTTAPTGPESLGSP